MLQQLSTMLHERWVKSEGEGKTAHQHGPDIEGGADGGVPLRICQRQRLMAASTQSTRPVTYRFSKASSSSPDCGGVASTCREWVEGRNGWPEAGGGTALKTTWKLLWRE